MTSRHLLFFLLAVTLVMGGALFAAILRSGPLYVGAGVEVSPNFYIQ
jgi:hypothetical protein